jgi:hypothetical protein
MSKEQTPITAEEFYLNNRGDLLRSNLGTKEFTIDMMEQYANAKVLEALERDRTNNLKHIQEDYKCSVCGNSEFEQK